jgi:hypothetical protein
VHDPFALLSTICRQLNSALEVTGEKKKDKVALTTKTLWIPAVNTAGEFGR